MAVIGSVRPEVGGRRSRYADWRPLGVGGTATVYRAFDTELSCDVAIKILKQEVMVDAQSRELMARGLRNEVLISRRLRHPNICAIHDLYDGPEGIGTVMDLIDGNELRKWMNDRRKDLLTTAPQRLDLLRKLTEALAYAHTLIIHRDIKPQNIFLKQGDIGEPIIMDFGFSVIGDKTGRDTSLAFTPKYMAPEQFEAPDKVDRRADLFALGILAYELFAGEVPPNSLKDIIRTRKAPRIPIEMIPPPSNFNAAVRPALDHLILQLLVYEPERRIQCADDMLATLRRPETLLYAEPIPDEGGYSLRKLQAAEVPGGDYLIGARMGLKTTKTNELPTRKIKLDSFLIDRNPVTNAEFREFSDSTGYPRPPLIDHPQFGALRQPVVAVTFLDAMEFARWSGGSLPSEAQWEHAARGGRPLAEYPWGDEPPTKTRANINKSREAPTPIESFPDGANPWGINDMCGNVWEWCLDVYEEKTYQNHVPGSRNPVYLPKLTGPAASAAARRVLRGGSFESFDVQGRCAFRFFARADERRNDIGFRLVYKVDT